MKGAIYEMTTSIKLVIQYCSLLFFLTRRLSECNKPCAYFEFHGLHDNSLTVKENTTINIEFSLHSEQCSGFQTTIQISALNVRTGIYVPRCNILLEDGRCSEVVFTSMSCLCNITNRLYRFMKTVHRSDNRQWKWSTLDGKANEAIISFNVIYPAQVTSLTLDGRNHSAFHSVVLNQSVTLTCSWENGYPPTTARLLDSFERVLVSSNDKTFTYSFTAAYCNLSGPIRCEAQHSFRSVELYIKCPPTFIQNSMACHHAVYGQDAILFFKFRANSLNTSGCNLTHMEHDSLHHCIFSPSMNVAYNIVHQNATNANLHSHAPEMKCSYIVTGTVPLLTLTILLQAPSRVTHISFNGYKDQSVYLASRNESVQIVCLWKRGYLPNKARLYNSHGHILQSSDDGLDIIYTFQSVDCNDAGDFTCYADNSSQNKSAKLLVKCAPEMTSTEHENITINESSHASLTVHFRAHTSTITRCDLAKYPKQYTYVEDELALSSYIIYICTFSKTNNRSNQHSKTNTEKCKCSVNGTEPILTLTIFLYDIANKDNGKWRATLENEFGNDFVDFYLIVNKDLVESTGKLIPINIVVPLTFVAIATILSVLCLKRWRNVKDRARCKPETSSTTLKTRRRNLMFPENTILDVRSAEMNTFLRDKCTMPFFSCDVNTSNCATGTLASINTGYLTPSPPSVNKPDTITLEDGSDINSIPVAGFDGYLTPSAEALNTSETIRHDQILTEMSCDRQVYDKSTIQIRPQSTIHRECNLVNCVFSETDFQLHQKQTPPSEEIKESLCKENSDYETIE